MWYIHDLLDILSNPTMFQVYMDKNIAFSAKLFDTAVTLKYDQSH